MIPRSISAVAEGDTMRARLLRRFVVLGSAVLFVGLMVQVAAAKPDHQRNFIAPLSGREEVPPVETRATGVAQFKVSRDGTEIEYRLNVANIENVTMAHIHLAAAGANGPVVVWLYPDEPPPQPIPGRFSGVLARGTITAADLVGPLAGEPLDALVEVMRAGETYVNVHTEQFPAGEVRGQIR
jgi:hypothetical protein